MQDIAIVFIIFLVGGALGFGVGYGVGARMYRDRRRRHSAAQSEFRRQRTFAAEVALGSRRCNRVV